MNLDINELKNIFSPTDFSIEIIQYNAMGEVFKVKDPSYLTLHMIRMQHKNITVNGTSDNLGSIIYADSFYQVSGHSLNTTKNIPALLSFYTTPKHYAHLPDNWFLDKGVKCERLGDRVFAVTNTEGVYPVKSQYKEILPNLALCGKFIVYEKGIIFEDKYLHNFIVDIKGIDKIEFYISKDTWAVIHVNENTSFPLNSMAESKVCVNIKNTLYSKDMAVLIEAVGEDKIEKIGENFLTKFKEYRLPQNTGKENVYTGHLDVERYQEEHRMFMEYIMLSMFNQIRSKSFISYSQFEQIWDTALDADKDLSDTSEKTKLILVSGIPGSGKTTFGIYLSKMFNNEKIDSSTFIMPVGLSTRFSCEDFLKGLFSHLASHPTSTVVAVIPSYHHLKKAIFEFKKVAQFNDTFDLQYVITRVSAKNFYRHKNRNTYQFLLENCLKGICDVVLFDKAGVNLNEIQLMRKQICEVNDHANILNVKGRTFEWSELQDILKTKDNKYALLYGKYFYGFEKEGRSTYYNECAVSGEYFKFKIPLRLDALEKRLHRVFTDSIHDFKDLVPEDEKRCDFTSTVDSTIRSENKENIESHEELGSEKAERWKVKHEKEKASRIKADLAQENMLIDEMKKKAPIIERIKGLFIVEGQEDECDYRLFSNFSEIKLKSCKNKEKRLDPEELGFLVYGKDVTEDIFKNLMSSFRSQLKSL